MKSRAIIVFLLFCFASQSGIGQQKKFIDPLSGTSLQLVLMKDNVQLATATGFVIQAADTSYLVTNWHVVSGIDPNTDSLLLPHGYRPNGLGIWFHALNLGTWTARIEPLYTADGKRRWLEHPKGKLVDVVLLPLTSNDKAVKIYPLDLSLAKTDMIPTVAMPVSIIGFPEGMSVAGKFPIWKTGHIASDPDLDVDDLPAFLIDATTRSGMSGSPVILRMFGGFQTRSGDQIMSQSGPSTLFLGVYSARYVKPELGKVWKPQAIYDILNNRAP